MNGMISKIRNDRLWNQTSPPPAEGRRLLPRDRQRGLSENPSIFARLVVDKGDREAAQALRHDAYAAAGYLRPSKTRQFHDKYDQNENSKTFVLYRGTVAVASARVCLLDHATGIQPSDQIPAYEMFPDEIDGYLSSDTHPPRRRAVEVTRLSRHPDYARDLSIMQAMFRMIGYLILFHDAHVMFAAITTNHIPFYRRMGFQLIANPRHYPGLDVQTALMGCPCQTHTPIKGHLSSLTSLSKHDKLYKSFMGGENCPVPPDPLARPDAQPCPPAAAHQGLWQVAPMRISA